MLAHEILERATRRGCVHEQTLRVPRQLVVVGVEFQAAGKTAAPGRANGA
jgi:hypothetical protein